MASKPATFSLGRLSIIVAGAVALYLAASLPAKSLVVRQPGYWQLERIWEPLPSVVKRALFDAWATIDLAKRDLL